VGNAGGVVGNAGGVVGNAGGVVGEAGAGVAGDAGWQAVSASITISTKTKDDIHFLVLIGFQILLNVG
jgi:hypothetical protein